MGATRAEKLKDALAKQTSSQLYVLNWPRTGWAEVDLWRFRAEHQVPDLIIPLLSIFARCNVLNEFRALEYVTLSKYEHQSERIARDTAKYQLAEERCLLFPTTWHFITERYFDTICADFLEFLIDNRLFETALGNALIKRFDSYKWKEPSLHTSILGAGTDESRAHMVKTLEYFRSIYGRKDTYEMILRYAEHRSCLPLDIAIHILYENALSFATLTEEISNLLSIDILSHLHARSPFTHQDLMFYINIRHCMTRDFMCEPGEGANLRFSVLNEARWQMLRMVRESSQAQFNAKQFDYFLEKNFVAIRTMRRMTYLELKNPYILEERAEVALIAAINAHTHAEVDTFFGKLGPIIIENDTVWERIIFQINPAALEAHAHHDTCVSPYSSDAVRYWRAFYDVLLQKIKCQKLSEAPQETGQASSHEISESSGMPSQKGLFRRGQSQYNNTNTAQASSAQDPRMVH